MFYYCFCNYDFSWEDIHYAEHIESIWWPAGINGAYEVRGDYCHIEALVVITLVMELVGSLWCSSSAALLMFRQQQQLPLDPPCNTSVSRVYRYRYVLIDPQRSTTDWTEETELKFSGSPICLKCVTFDAVAFSRWSVPQVTTQSWWVTVPALTATYTLRSASSLPPTHSWKWAVIKYSDTHMLIQRRAAISMLWCMGCHGCLVGGEVEVGGLRLLSLDDGASPLTRIFVW